MADEDFELALVANERCRLGFRYKVDDAARDLSDYQWQSQARQKESGTAKLILDLTQYLALDDDDNTLLVLDIPGGVTSGLPAAKDTAWWDIFIWPTGEVDDAIRLLQGPVTLDLATTVIGS